MSHSLHRCCGHCLEDAGVERTRKSYSLHRRGHCIEEAELERTRTRIGSQKVELQGVSARGLNRQRSFLLEIRALSPHAEQR
jgi:hypothetical protein